MSVSVKGGTPTSLTADLGRRRFQLEKSWGGKAPSKLVSYPATGNIVHRIKVDEKNGLIITSTGFSETPEERTGPALIVSDMKHPDKVLWSLPSVSTPSENPRIRGLGILHVHRHTSNNGLMSNTEMAI